MAKKKQDQEKRREDQDPLEFARSKSTGRRIIATKAYHTGKVEKFREQNIKQGWPCWRILRYRRVVEPDDIPLPMNLSSFVTPKTFETHMKYLSRECDLISLEDLIQRIDNYEEIPEKAVAVTFDGGHMDNYLHALPILTKYNVPATMFVPTGYVETSGVFFFEDQIALAMSLFKNCNLPVPKFSFLESQVYEEIEKESPEFKVNEAAVSLLIRGLRRVTKEQRNDALLIIAHMLENVAPPPEWEDFMRWDDLRHMAQYGINFGLIGHSYTVATDLSAEEFVEDLSKTLELLSSQEIPLQRVYAFPEGLFSQGILAALRTIQVRYALTMGNVPEPRYQTALPMILSRMTMSEPASYCKELFACRLWNIEISGVTF